MLKVVGPKFGQASVGLATTALVETVDVTLDVVEVVIDFGILELLRLAPDTLATSRAPQTLESGIAKPTIPFI